MDNQKKQKFNKSWISIHRKIENWEWYTDVNTCKLFLHCLIKANWKNKKWQNQEIKRGQFVTSIEKLSIETGLTKMKIRTALNKLVSSNEISKLSSDSRTVITVNNYSQYQENEETESNESTINSEANKTNTSNNKNFKNEELFYGEYKNVYLSDKQYNDLTILALGKKNIEQIIEDFGIAIETGKETGYKEELPNAHYERLKKYWEWRKTHPKKTERKENDETQTTNEYNPFS